MATGDSEACEEAGSDPASFRVGGLTNDVYLSAIGLLEKLVSRGRRLRRGRRGENADESRTKGRGGGGEESSLAKAGGGGRGGRDEGRKKNEPLRRSNSHQIVVNNQL